ncbi:Clp protease N-terminal domain-containing protein [Streptomyces sp. TP-A0356]|uniref:Clp protease N-terminal domain-containing protein n=1 Tax=Streptomyces sp. TP-A0356 TaxID=1359208 RepID=UPI0006E143B4|nr:Clp protease N-terminal domain-containing protein [Streptomyces sp. TP-A0356]
MFERFTKDARAVVTGAVEHCERTGGERVEEAHLLLALLDREGGRAAFALASLGLTARRDAVERDLADARRRGGLSRADADALSGLGIDLTEIVSRVEETYGQGALAADRTGGVRRSGRRPFTRGAKDLLTQSLRAALAHGDRHIGDEHLLLALTARPGVPSDVLADHGVTCAAVERVLWGGDEARAG